MTKIVRELAQGNSFSRSAENGALADVATRSWKVILESPNEQLDIFAAIGVRIGDIYSTANPIPCVSIEGRADGDSRLVRIITANYRSTPGIGAVDEGGGGGPSQNEKDPKSVEPTSRFASVQVSTSAVEIPAWTWISNPTVTDTFSTASNPVGDMYDGVTRFEPVVEFRFTQFESVDPTGKLEHIGKVNNNEGTFGGLTLFPRSTLFRGCTIQMHVESWGGLLYRGYTVGYEFAYRRNTQSVMVEGGFLAPAAEQVVDIGWDMAVPQTGFNVKAFNPAQLADRELFGQPLRHFSSTVQGPPYFLPNGVNVGDKVRAMVKVADYRNGGVSQAPSSQPVALNNDGTPRADTSSPKVLVYRRGHHQSFDFEALGLRLPI